MEMINEITKMMRKALDPTVVGNRTVNSLERRSKFPKYFSLSRDDQNFPNIFHFPEYDRISWQISRYKLLKLGHLASCSWSERCVSKKGLYL